MHGTAQQGDVRQKVIDIYTSQIGVREATGKNDGPQVEAYLKYTKLGKGYAWCSSFCCWVYGQAGVENPRSAWSPALVPASKVIYGRGRKGNQIPQAGDVFGIYFANMKRVAHVGFVDKWGDKEVVTVEGNTNGAGSRDGDGVYKKKRLTAQIYCVARYIN